MDILSALGDFAMAVFHAVYNVLWGDLITVPLPGGSSLGISLLVIILIPSGIYFTIRTRALPVPAVSGNAENYSREEKTYLRKGRSREFRR